MTRIIAGQAGGRRLRVPPTGTRPTSDRVREAMFSLIEHRLDLAGCHVLDLFAGSGALGLEAASRGASAVVLVESARPAAAIAAANARELGLPAEVVTAKVENYIGRQMPQAPFELVLADPPYDFPARQLDVILTTLAGSGALAPGGLILVERDLTSPDPLWPEVCQGVMRRAYGTTVLHLAQVRE